MKCSICQSNLVVTGKAPLETLAEHVSSPEGPVSLKDKYTCSNPDCPGKNFDVCWNSYGEFYCKPFYATRELKFFENLHDAIGSQSRKVERELNFDREEREQM